MLIRGIFERVAKWNYLLSGEAALAGDLEPVQVGVFMEEVAAWNAGTGRCVLPWAQVPTHIPTLQGLRSDHAAGGVDLKPDVKETIFPRIFGRIFC